MFIFFILFVVRIIFMHSNWKNYQNQGSWIHHPINLENTNIDLLLQKDDLQMNYGALKSMPDECGVV